MWSVINGLKVYGDKCFVLESASWPPDLVQSLSDSGVLVKLHEKILTLCNKVKTFGVGVGSNITFIEQEHVTHSSLRVLGGPLAHNTTTPIKQFWKLCSHLPTTAVKLGEYIYIVQILISRNSLFATF